jgi:hypothetical protein
MRYILVQPRRDEGFAVFESSRHDEEAGSFIKDDSMSSNATKHIPSADNRPSDISWTEEEKARRAAGRAVTVAMAEARDKAKADAIAKSLDKTSNAE